MRIFYAAADSPNYWQLPQSRIWYVNLFLPLQDLGHELITFDYDYGLHNNHLDPGNPQHKVFIDEHRPTLGSELLRQIEIAHEKAPIDVFFSYFYSAYVHPEIIRHIGQMGITTINWYCNGSYQFDLVAEIAPAYHFCLVPEKFRLEDYRRVGANPIYCQEAANPNVYKPYPLAQEYDVTFVGQRYGNRPTYISRLLDAEIGVQVFGPRWDERLRPGQMVDERLQSIAGGALSDGDLIRMYSRSRVNLGFSAVARIPKDGSKPIMQVRLRDFEAPMSGAFYMVEHFDELMEFFEPDKEIVTFRDADELVSKCRYYLEHPAARERIRDAGARRARNEHTWQKRFSGVFQQIGLA